LAVLAAVAGSWPAKLRGVVRLGVRGER